jgi:hypothetical protein
MARLAVMALTPALWATCVNVTRPLERRREVVANLLASWFEVFTALTVEW